MSTKRRSPAGCFLKIVAALILLFIAGAFAYRIFEKELMRWAMVPSVDFREVANPAGADYAQAGMWIARPDIAGNPALWTPEGFAATATPRAAVFFVHPTSFLERTAWNAPVTDAESQNRAALFVRSQASAFKRDRRGLGAQITARRPSAPS